MPGLTALDFEPMPAAAAEADSDPAASRMSGNGGEAAPSGEAATAAAAGAVAVAAATGAMAALAIPADGGEEGAAAGAGAGSVAVAVPGAMVLSPGGAASVTSPSTTAGSPKPPDEKLNKFVDFLSGDNPGACMFHAQMRLSLDGCRKLANFVGSSTRVKALSLSHNHIGEDGGSVSL